MLWISRRENQILKNLRRFKPEKDVAKENGYTYIFDTSPGIGVVLYADESTDVTALVKAKLGM